MKKQALLLAGAMLAGAACAQSSVTLYGVIDAGIASRSGGSGAAPSAERMTEIGSGMGSGGSRWGLRGAETLSPGLTAFFEIEWGFEGDTGQGTTAFGDGLLRTRHNHVGLSGSAGTFLLGRVDGGRATFAKVYDPFKGAGVGGFGGLATQLTTVNNAMVYISPSWQGLSLTGAYVTAGTGEEQPGNVGDTRIYVIWPTYKIGNLQISWDHEEVWVSKSNYPRLKVDELGATYDFGIAKVFGQFDRTRSSGGAFNNVLDDQKAWMLGASVPVSAEGLLKASYGRVKRDNLADFSCSKVAIGYEHRLSKRTHLYADAARISNSSGANCQLGLRNEDGNLENFASKPVYGTRGFDVGIAHSF